MKFWMAGEIESDVADDFREVRNKVEHLINSYLEAINYTNENLIAWDCIAIIRNDNDFKPRIRYSSKTKETDFRLPINHSDFKNGSANEKLDLILNLLRSSLEILGKKYKMKNFEPVYEVIGSVAVELKN
jgi:hypothetical protein